MANALLEDIDVNWKVHSDEESVEGGFGEYKLSESWVAEKVSESIVVLEISDWRERRRIVIFPEKKEQNDSAIELDESEFGSGLE